MAEKTICPACSAPITISAEDQQVRCDFCGAVYAVALEGGEPHLQVIEQPQPQKDELSQAGQQAAMEAGKEAADELAAALSESSPEIQTPPDEPPAFSEPTIIYSRQEPAPDFFDQTGASSEPTVFRPAENPPVDVPAESSLPFESPSEPAPEAIPPAPAPEPSVVEPPPPVAEGVLYDRHGPVPTAGSPAAPKRNQWLPWVIGAVVVLCLACVCIGAAVVMVFLPVMQQ